ncbi:DUF4349 domain-containing protein [Kitasatospora sp. NPDC004240]
MLAAGAVVAVLLVGGCGGAGSGDSSTLADAAAPAKAPEAAGAAEAGGGAGAAPNKVAPNAPAAGSPAPGARAGSGSGSGASAGPAAPDPVVAKAADTRQIAYSAQLSLRSKDVPKLLEQARTVATAAGGYVGSENTGGAAAGTTEGAQNGQITVKVPSAAFQQTLDQLAGLGEVVSRRSQAEDVTQQVADVAGRVQTQQASVDRIRALMAQAKTIGEVTSLESELARRESDLESLLRQQKELAAKTSLSTITVDARREARPVHNDAPDVKKEDGFGDSVTDALGNGWRALLAIVRGIAVTVAVAAPFLLVAVPLVVLIRFLRRRRAPKLPPVPAHGPWPAPVPPARDGNADGGTDGDTDGGAGGEAREPRPRQEDADR